MCIILSNSKRGQTPMLISYTMKEALYCLSQFFENGSCLCSHVFISLGRPEIIEKAAKIGMGCKSGSYKSPN